MPSGPIFTDEKAVTYIEKRLFGANAKPPQVNHIELYQAFLSSTVQDMVRYRGEMVRVMQDSPREDIFLQGDTLIICETSGFARARRYKENIKRYLEITGRNITFEGIVPENDPAILRQYYSNMAYDFIRRIFVPRQKYYDERVFKNTDAQIVSSIEDIVFGQPDVVAKKSDTLVEKGESKYLDAQIVKIGNRNVLNLGYVYGDQAGVILDKILNEIYSQGHKITGREVNIYVFGRVGGLNNDARRDDLIAPSGVINESEMKRGVVNIHPIDNILASKGRASGLSFNADSVIGETYEALDAAKALGCETVDLELFWFYLAKMYAENLYSNMFDGQNSHINLGYIGHVSDVPLRGDLLDVELPDNRGAESAFDRIAQHIRKR